MTTVKSIDAKTAQEWVKNNEAVIVDVREPSEHSATHIRGAKLIPVGTIEVSKLPEFKHKKLIIHCQIGRRGENACEKLLQENPDLEVYNLEGGIAAWENAGFQVEKAEKSRLPLNQQVQAIIGGGVLVGVILGYILHPIFFILSAFLGGGLLYVGLTGSSSLTQLVAKLPWNK